MEESTIWWLAAGVVVVAELLTGTFYLLMVALGLVAAAISAHLGWTTAAQMVAAAAVGGGAVVACYYARRKGSGEPSARADRSVNLDVGEAIMIDNWSADGTTTVKYRGTQWTAIHRPGVTPSTGMHRVAELVGSRLLVDPI